MSTIERKTPITRIVEEKMAALFSEKKPFSEHLSKWEDASFPDKYDHNCFEYTGQPTEEEFKDALDYQKRRGDCFIKLEGDRPLKDSFGLEAGITLTMELKSDAAEWKRNEIVSFAAPSLEELEQIEVKHYGPVYGEDFSRRNVRRLYEKFRYHGAYMGSELAAACYSFSSDGMICIDGLIVDEALRHQYIATALIAHIAETNKNSRLFLHADEEDTPKDMYLKMGFEITDRLYEYSRTDLDPDNPWKSIPLSDYENHMSLDSVKQLQTMNLAMKNQLELHPASTIMILGIAGGNGLEHIDTAKCRAVYGVDINPSYLQETAKRYPELSSVLECLCVDLTKEADRLPKAELLIANLLIEYIGYKAFQDVARQVSPSRISCIIQINKEEGFVSESPYLHAFDRLDEVHHQMEEMKLTDTLNEIGYHKITSQSYPLPNSKELVQLDYTLG